jgi:uncharacterized membrane protein
VSRKQWPFERAERRSQTVARASAAGALLQKPRDTTRTVNVDVLTEVVIARPRDVVSAFAADADRAPVWYENIKTVEWRTPRPLAVGSRVAFVAQFLGRRLEYTYEVVEWVPNERFVMRTADGPFPMETTYEWEDADRGATRMRLRNRGTPTGFSRWLAPVMGMAVRRANRKDLAALKAVLESSMR